MYLYLFFIVFTVVFGLPVVIFLVRKDKLEETGQEQAEPLLINWEQKVLLAKVYRDAEQYYPLLQDVYSSTPWTSKDFWEQKEPQEKKEERVDKSDEKE